MNLDSFNTYAMMKTIHDLILREGNKKDAMKERKKERQTRLTNASSKQNKLASGKEESHRKFELNNLHL